MEVRRFIDSDIGQIVSLFYETVHSINAQDYTQEQLHAWAPTDEKRIKMVSWKDSMNNNIAYVAEIKGVIVGFSDMTYDGYLDRLFIHKDFQGQGIASNLLNILESEARKLRILEIYTDASITAKPFFERHGYRTIHSQTVERRGVQLNNFKMMKTLEF
ncbi:GNAT family N-acetyltransferase [Ammoniphilus resinae]|uniref:Acetyltransferase n=1 Tax=Ammoniphilus resinae TaxID=861532 RepID=A0ABS4GKQ5_9BACL|nr:GNAT family N-acetyltransferase [Ammoniphilus resinae]MBP1930851.1 putative acetyltransferase [Ammoniphilus resinae]